MDREYVVCEYNRLVGVVCGRLGVYEGELMGSGKTNTVLSLWRAAVYVSLCEGLGIGRYEVSLVCDCSITTVNRAFGARRDGKLGWRLEWIGSRWVPLGED